VVSSGAGVRICRYCGTANFASSEFCDGCFRTLAGQPVVPAPAPAPLPPATELQRNSGRWTLLTGLAGIAVLIVGGALAPATPAVVYLVGAALLFFGIFGFLIGWQTTRILGVTRGEPRPPERPQS
jgi:hypothetical protein